MMTSRRLARVASLALASGAACFDLGPGGTRRIAGFLGDPTAGRSVIIAPETVHVAVPFGATVYTFGSSCNQPDGADIGSTGRTVTVTPYDRVPADPGVACPSDITARAHPLTLAFTVVGLDTIVARGRVTDGSSGITMGALSRVVEVVP